MNASLRGRGALCAVTAAAWLTLGAGAAHGGIVGLLEAPTGIASGISNVQGWVYTTTPGAKLVQPFDVLVDGAKVMQVPCCADRGDVKAAHPEAPLATGFSAVFNWSLITDPLGPLADRPEGELAPNVVEVLVRDDKGGMATLSSTVEAVQAGFEFNRTMSWFPLGPPPKATARTAGGILPTDSTMCDLSNDSAFAPSAASLWCDIVVFEAPDRSLQGCVSIRFDWDPASQSFRLVTTCIPASSLPTLSPAGLP